MKRKPAKNQTTTPGTDPHSGWTVTESRITDSTRTDYVASRNPIPRFRVSYPLQGFAGFRIEEMQLGRIHHQVDVTTDPRRVIGVDTGGELGLFAQR